MLPYRVGASNGRCGPREAPAGLVLHPAAGVGRGARALAGGARRRTTPRRGIAAPCAYLKVDDADGAPTEMRKVISIDPTHHQAWSAPGGIFAKKRMKREALFAFREACKLQSHNAELWMHAALAALDLGHFHEAIYAEALLDYGGAPAPQISSLLAQAVAKDLKDEGDGRRTRLLLDRCRILLVASTQRVPTHAVHWDARGCTSSKSAARTTAPLRARCWRSSWRRTRRTCRGRRTMPRWSRSLRWRHSSSRVSWKARRGAPAACSEGDAGRAAVRSQREARRVARCEQLRMLMSRIQRHDDD